MQYAICFTFINGLFQHRSLLLGCLCLMCQILGTKLVHILCLTFLVQHQLLFPTEERLALQSSSPLQPQEQHGLRVLGHCLVFLWYH